MKRRSFLATACLLVTPGAGAADDYPAVVPGRALAFPRDFGSHPDYRLEWWYVTAWVADPDGAPYGVQITFFRNRPRVAEDSASHFAPRQLLFAHAAVADPRRGRLRYDQRAAREGFGLAGAAEESTDVWIDDWSLKRAQGSYRAQIAARDFTFDLRFTPTQVPLLEGDAGFSRKGAELRQSSAYYSEPQLAVSGQIVADTALAVTGVAWLDHEWSSEVMAAHAAGWDWIGINLADGGALMAFRMRDHAGGTLWAGGSLRAADGSQRRFEPHEVRFEPRRQWRSPRTGVVYPVAMRVDTAMSSYALEPLLDDQELDSRPSTGAIYWEGAVRAEQSGHEVGRGYLELTGYGAPLKL
ncbi:MAG TPA: lipocalin-like domain-containing protein [Casimicrobiaceae bacterium]|nr:lipocalin-like domain-containing protein [Casimicrobiaceae bacterium]